jgi:Protein of unknown function (DUF3996)
MTRKLVLASLTALLVVTAVGTASAQEKNVGLGFIIGEPTGIDIKFNLNKVHALEFALAWSLSDDNDLHIQGDYLWHKYDVIKLDSSDELPLFFGIGGRIIIREDDIDDTVGVRFPVGLDYIFANYPFDIFVEIVPILDLAPDTDFDLEGALGARFWF